MQMHRHLWDQGLICGIPLLPAREKSWTIGMPSYESAEVDWCVLHRQQLQRQLDVLLCSSFSLMVEFWFRFLKLIFLKFYLLVFNTTELLLCKFNIPVASSVFNSMMKNTLPTKGTFKISISAGTPSPVVSPEALLRRAQRQNPFLPPAGAEPAQPAGVSAAAESGDGQR